jgi:hypothetical protein
VVPFDARCRREAADRDSQGVRRVELVVAKRREHERAGSFDATAEQAEDVEGRLVGPVEVLQHEHGRLSAQLLDKGTEHLVGARVACDQLSERTARLRGDIRKGSERSGCEERIACTFEDSATSRGIRPETTNQGGLAYARLAGDQHQARFVLDLMKVSSKPRNGSLEEPAGYAHG